MTVRYAIYFAPARDSALWQAGCRWLGRDPESGARLAPPCLPHYGTEQWAHDTQSARRYGFHATLKAPFRLSDGHTEAQLVDAIRAFAALQQPFVLPRLEVDSMGDFLALRPVAGSAPLRDLAAACVTQFDAFRRPPQADEIARRLASGLTAKQQAMLSRWGYPYVLDEYRFHMTLTDRLPAQPRAILQAMLASHFGAALDQRLQFGDIALFVEREAGREFQLIQRFPLAGTTGGAKGV